MDGAIQLVSNKFLIVMDSQFKLGIWRVLHVVYSYASVS